MHVLDELAPARVRAGWTLPAALAGLLAAAAGGWLVRSIAEKKSACEFAAAVDAITGADGAAMGCGGVSLQFNVGAVLVAFGALLALVALLVAARRGRAAARQGHPWPVRRILTRLAAVVDRLLPGGSAGGAPRISSGVMGALLACLLFVGLIGVHNAWDDHQRRTEAAHRATAEAALARLVLPAGITAGAAPDSGCTASAGTLCAFSTRSMEELRPALESLLAGQSRTEMCELVPQPSGMDCPVTVVGEIAGYQAMAIASQHMILVRDGDPPVGAVPLRTGTDRGVFVKGTDVTVSLLPLG